MRRITLLAVGLALGIGPHARAESAHEYELKAAFLLNFVRLVQWPDSAFSEPGQPLTIGVFVDDPFQGALEPVLKGERIRGRALRTRRVASAAEARGTHLLFVPATQSERLAELVEQLSGVPILLVGESERFAERGGVVNLFEERGRIRFEINRGAADQAGLKLSSRLLRLARLVGAEAE